MADGYAQAAPDQQAAAEQSLADFLRELTHLSRRTGIAINGNPELVLMDAEDQGSSYKADDESRLSLS